MIKKFQNYIEQGSWEEDLEKADDLLNCFCWVVIILASVYFSPAVYQILAREVF